MLPCGFLYYFSVSFGAGGAMIFLVLLQSLVFLISVTQSTINLPAYSRSTFSFSFVVHWINMHYGENVVGF